MENILIGIATFLVSAVIFTFIGMYIRKKIAESKMESAENEAKKIIERAKLINNIEKIDILKKEVNELISIFVSSIKTAKSNS